MLSRIGERSIRLLRRFSRNRSAFFGLIVVLLFGVVAVFAHMIAPYSPIEINLSKIRALPSWEHPLGADELGRDIFSRIVYGARLAFYVGFIAVGIAVGAGVPLGLLAGYRGGPFGYVIMRIMDLLFCFPFLLLAIVIVCALGPGIENGTIAIGLGLVPVYTRLARAMTLSVKEEQYVEAAVMSGENDANILFRYILPNSISPIIVQATLDLPKAILASATLSFLGLGAQPPTPEWGAIITTARLYIHLAPHLAIFPGLALMILVLGFNFFGDGLRDFLDPRLRSQAS